MYASLLSCNTGKPKPSFWFNALNLVWACANTYIKEIAMRYIIGWLLGVPLSILVIIWLVSHI